MKMQDSMKIHMALQTHILCILTNNVSAPPLCQVQILHYLPIICSLKFSKDECSTHYYSQTFIKEALHLISSDNMSNNLMNFANFTHELTKAGFSLSNYGRVELDRSGRGI